MPKMKTKSGAKKRFELTGTGRIKRKHAYHGHILTKKSQRENATWITPPSLRERTRRSSNKCFSSKSIV